MGKFNLEKQLEEEREEQEKIQEEEFDAITPIYNSRNGNYYETN